MNIKERFGVIAKTVHNLSFLIENKSELKCLKVVLTGCLLKLVPPVCDNPVSKYLQEILGIYTDTRKQQHTLVGSMRD